MPGLFQISPSGVSTEPVRNAAERFIASLNSVQLAKAMFPIDDIQWQKWMNQHFYVRQGVSFQEMTEAQRELAFGLMRASLSTRGFELTRNVMRLNETLAELAEDPVFLGEWLYFITIMGIPSATDPWGWQFSGHHAIVNFFVLGDQVVMTPLFRRFGAGSGYVGEIQGRGSASTGAERWLGYGASAAGSTAAESDSKLLQDRK